MENFSIFNAKLIIFRSIIKGQVHKRSVLKKTAVVSFQSLLQHLMQQQHQQQHLMEST
jgi:hypothetical protein